jgi:AraC-like DNA-binding protein
MASAVPEILNECRRKWRASGQYGEPNRSAMLHSLLHNLGARKVLELCESFAAHIPPSPLMFLLFNSSTPGEFIRKITHHSGHFHQSRRLELTEDNEHFVVVEDIVVHGEDNAPVEDLFVLGILKSGLQELGCQGIEVVWEAVRSQELKDLLNEIDIWPIAVEGVTRWRFSWDEINKQVVIRGLDDFFLEKSRIHAEQTPTQIIQEIGKMLKADLHKRPTMEAVAERLGLSTRTLQRKLEAAGTSYSTLHKNIRLKTAESLLRTTTMKLAEISQLAGFNDSAHFCREFKKHHRETPTDFRRRPG